MKLLFLGTAQDAGVPQINCYCENCQNARKHPTLHRLGPSLALYNESNQYCYLFDASPDIKRQIDMLKANAKSLFFSSIFPVLGIFLTHAHFGHVSGLWYLGRESMNAHKVTAYGSEKMSAFLMKHHPFSHLIEDQNIVPYIMKPRVKYPIEDFKIECFNVPHRGKYTDTVGYFITSNLRIVYLPDTDFWNEESIIMIEKADIAILDGTFYSRNEIADIDKIPHPPVDETIELLKSIDTEIYFTHFNHTNPILNEASEERKKATENDFKIAFDGLIIDI
jgi:pyrroloquinoline quinone biosynthesis protein B